jgi:hypothetical protein
MEKWCRWENAGKGSSCGIDRIHSSDGVITMTRSAPNLPPDLSKSVTRSRRDDAAASLHRKTHYRSALEKEPSATALSKRAQQFGPNRAVCITNSVLSIVAAAGLISRGWLYQNLLVYLPTAITSSWCAAKKPPALLVAQSRTASRIRRFRLHSQPDIAPPVYMELTDSSPIRMERTTRWQGHRHRYAGELASPTPRLARQSS